MATRRFINKDGTLDGTALVQVDLKPPEGSHWLWAWLTASYSGAVIAGMRIDSWYEDLVSSDGDVQRRVTLVRAPVDNYNMVPIVGGVVAAGVNPVLVGVNRPILQFDKHHLSVAYSLVTVNGRAYQIRGMVWESTDLNELMCMGRGAL
jgi:hypothetical protein